jgi:hypothetical protein
LLSGERLAAKERITKMVIESALTAGKPKKLLDQMRDVLRLKHYSLCTEHCYCDWVRRCMRFHRLRHPREMGAAEIGSFLTHLARDDVAASTQNQAVERDPFPLSASAEVRGRLDS